MCSVPSLFAIASGLGCTGPLRCFFCGAPCDGSLSASEHVKDSFTGRNEVAAPQSPAVCVGCVLCLREACDVPMVDGATRPCTKAAMRSWSWLVTPTRAAAGSKGDIAFWRETCLVPPEPPFAVVLSDSGQKQLLYRGVVNHSRQYVAVTLETERVAYYPGDLRQRITLCEKVCAVTGKPALAAPVDFRIASAVIAAYPDGENLIEQWSRVREEPLSRLAAWLCGNKEYCQREHDPAGGSA
jgi:hypothetical protein